METAVLTFSGNGELAYISVPRGKPDSSGLGSARKCTHDCPSVKMAPRTGGKERATSSTILLGLLSLLFSSGLTKSLKSCLSCSQCDSVTGRRSPGSHSSARFVRSVKTPEGWWGSAFLKDESSICEASTRLVLTRFNKRSANMG